MSIAEEIKNLEGKESSTVEKTLVRSVLKHVSARDIIIAVDICEMPLLYLDETCLWRNKSTVIATKTIDAAVKRIKSDVDTVMTREIERLYSHNPIYFHIEVHGMRPIAKKIQVATEGSYSRAVLGLMWHLESELRKAIRPLDFHTSISMTFYEYNWTREEDYTDMHRDMEGFRKMLDHCRMVSNFAGRRVDDIELRIWNKFEEICTYIHKFDVNTKQRKRSDNQFAVTLHGYLEELMKLAKRADELPCARYMFGASIYQNVCGVICNRLQDVGKRLIRLSAEHRRMKKDEATR